MHKNQFYEAPDAELIVVRFEENIMSIGDATSGYDGENNLGELED